MTLTAALQAKLAKRGILPQNQQQQQQQRNQPSQASGGDEEVIAESYDDPTEQTHQTESGVDVEEAINCPNLSNPYHECSAYCKKRYGLKVFQPNPVMERRRIRMLKIYPLPPGWKECPDIHTNRYYYWNTETDQVSWLSPSHPKAEITMAAPKKNKNGTEVEASSSKKSRFESDNEEENEDDENEEEDDDDEEEEDDDDEEEEDEEIEDKSKSDSFNQDLDEFLNSVQNSSNNNRKNDRNTNRNKQVSRSRRGGRDDVVDPMDPASYSEIPRGKWSDGLNVKGRGGAADDTASGPLFQMRPYPSPGAILKMNQEKKTDKK